MLNSKRPSEAVNVNQLLAKKKKNLIFSLQYRGKLPLKIKIEKVRFSKRGECYVRQQHPPRPSDSSSKAHAEAERGPTGFWELHPACL